MPHHYSAEIKNPAGQTIMVRDVHVRNLHVHYRQEAVSEIARFQQHFARSQQRLAQDAAWTDWQTLRCNGWTKFAGDAGTLFLQNLRAPTT